MNTMSRKSLNKNFKNITHYYKKLTNFSKENKTVGNTNEWIIDNYYLISQEEKSIRKYLSEMKKITKSRKECLNSVVYNFLRTEDYRLDEAAFFSYVLKYQEDTKIYFSYDEDAYLIMCLKYHIICKLSELVLSLNKKFNEKKEVDECFNKLANLSDNGNKIELKKCIKFDKSLLSSNYKILEINQRLNKLGDSADLVYDELSHNLLKNNLNLKDIINNEFEERTNENVLVTNIFYSLKNAIRIDLEDVYKNLNLTEKLLINESASIYKNQDSITKDQYREQIKKRCVGCEYEYTKKLLLKSGDEHIGFKLFKVENNELSSRLYIAGIVLFTVILEIIIFNLFGLIPAIIFIVPLMGFVIDIINQVLIKAGRALVPPKLEFKDGIPDECTTMIVIPTILNNKNKVNKMFDNLEKYYLSNKSQNLYFTLLGDVSSEKVKSVPHDSDVVSAGLEASARLNEKYNKNLFNFVYRNRFYNEGEGSYLGFERKRGALIHFNKLLLNKLTNKEIKEYFKEETISSNNYNIKYVITLDADTELLLNSGLKLIGAMAHPMNTPVLNKEKTKVIKGHALMQPRVSIDVEVTSKSFYSQLFAGFGGLDVYSVKQFDLYQDVFGEGSFTGKGIYDLAIFDSLLGETFPNNLILSHDLLEGSYLRCGYLSDTEVYDGFPSKYLNDLARHHRWTRGDFQISPWLFKKVKNKEGKKIKNPLNLISKWKIFDNLRRSLKNPTLLLLLIYAFIFLESPVLMVLLISVIIMTPIIFYLFNNLFDKNRYSKSLKYYLKIVFGFSSVLEKTFIVLSTLPYEAYLYMDAIIRSMYRMHISKKNLLNWVVSEDVDKFNSNNLSTYVRKFMPNYLATILLVLFAMYHNEGIALGLVIGFIWSISPVIMYSISRDFKKEEVYNFKKQESYFREIAFSTWNFFSTHLTKEYNYLVPDNYQENRFIKVDERTSPTNIGFSLVSVISAYELKIINLDDTVDYINNIIKNIETLEKWNGHLYNWYNIKSKKVIEPFFVSTADSGNFVSSLYVVKGFLSEHKSCKSLLYRVEKLIDETNFNSLYNNFANVFSIGYDVHESKLSTYHYNNFVSEARVASYIAIAKGDVPIKHWFSLDKTLTKYKQYKGIASFTGTMFEYYMPLIFMKTYDHTLLDETYSFAAFTHMDFMKEVGRNLPWGITESAYSELDDSQNYKYKAFGIPYLKFFDNENPKIVTAPYGSIMALSKYPNEVYNNIKKFQKLNMSGVYGLYEAFDAEVNEPVYSYFSHHQGMILSSITNYLKNNKIQEYFHADKKIASIEILLKEKTQIKTYIDLKISKYRRAKYRRESIESDIRFMDKLEDIPSVGVLSNGSFTTFLTDRGIGFSKYKNLYINRYRKNTSENYGTFVYIKNNDSKKVWTNTYLPNGVEPDNYEVIFSSDNVEYRRTDDSIITKTKIIVTKDHNAELRKITINNNSETQVSLSLTSYFEAILARLEEDIAHRTFNNLTIKSDVDKISSSLIFSRKSRTKEDVKYYVVNRFFEIDDKGDFEYETSRMNFLGRNNSTINPDMVIKDNAEMSSDIKELLEPIMSIKKNVVLMPGEKKEFYLLVGFGKSMEQVMDIVYSYNTESNIETAFEKTTILSNIRKNIENIDAKSIKAYNELLKHVYLPIRDESKTKYLSNNLGQSDLWKFGISGDLPIVLAEITDSSNTSYILDVIKAYEFYKARGIYLDFVFLNKETRIKSEIITKYIERKLSQINYFTSPEGSVKIVDEFTIDEEELLRKTAVISLTDTEKKSIYLDLQDTSNKVYFNPVKQNDLEVKKYDITESKFSDTAYEYIVNGNNTLMPWSNVICNESFGTVVTNNMGGFTYAYNSREYKLTSWSNDPVSDTYSEAIFINDKRVIPSTMIHGFGYSKAIVETDKYKLEITIFVPTDNNCKIYDVKIDTENIIDLDIDLRIRPVLGVTSENTVSYLKSDYDAEKNIVSITNSYNKNFGKYKMYLTSSESITDYIDNYYEKIIKINLNTKTTNRFSFTIGVSEDDNQRNILEIDKLDNTLETTKTYWKDLVSNISINSPDKSLNTLFNGWLLYQVYASRLYSRAAFYQVGGATGFRDQLQDSMCLIQNDPSYTRRQILTQAKHQFIEGDVLHWWHEDIMFGARTRFSDDYLWLVYVTYEYVTSTGDVDILEEQVQFVEADVLGDSELEKGVNFTYSNYTKSLREHLTIAINKALSSFGRNGLPLMGSGDWNDGMNKVGKDLKGESVWVGFFLYDLLLKVTKLTSDPIFINKCLERRDELKASIENNAWDSKWYLRAFFDNKSKLGSSESDECRIDLISQSWSILTGLAPTSKHKSIIKEVEKNLVDRESGIIKLLTPPFEHSKPNPGYISDYLPGVRENGAQYTHAALWYIIALIRAGYRDKAYEMFSMINPVNKDPKTYKVEPYVIAADVYSHVNFKGMGGWTWYTGSASWAYKTILEEIMGINRVGDKLKINPNIPDHLVPTTIKYKYINTTYNIKIEDSNNDIIIDLIDDQEEHNIII